MERVGLAWNVIRIAPERQEAKLATPGTAGRTKFKPFLSPVSGSSQPPLA